MKLKAVILILGVGVMFFSCVKRKNTDPVPTISYENFFAQNEDIGYLTINYTDGDGDIFAEKDTKDNNFFAWFYYKDTDGSFKPALTAIHYPTPYTADTIVYSQSPIAYTVYRPSDLSKDQPIKGQITISMVGWRSDSKYKNFKYKIYMVDQKGNKTEEIMTSEIYSP
jgi:hypothetical protein